MTGPQRAHDIRLSAARIIVFLGFGILLFWLVLRSQNLALIGEKIAGAHWGWAALSLVFAALSQIIRAARWNLLIQPLGYRPRLSTTTGAVLIGYLANLAIPRIGEVTRCGVLARHEGVPFDRVLGTVVTERIIDVLTILLCLGVLLALEFARIASMASRYILEPVLNKLSGAAHSAAALWALALLGIVLFLVVRAVSVRTAGSERGKRLRQLMRGFLDGLRSVGSLEHPGLFVVYSLLIWLMYLFMAWVCFRGFDATIGLGPTAALAVVVFGGIGFAAPVQGGLGAFELVVAPAIVAFGVPADDALSYTILYHATQVAGMLLFGLVALVTLPFASRHLRAKPAVPAG